MISGIEDPLIPFSNSEKISIESQTKLFKVNSGHMSINENIDEIVTVMHLIGYLYRLMQYIFIPRWIKLIGDKKNRSFLIILDYYLMSSIL